LELSAVTALKCLGGEGVDIRILSTFLVREKPRQKGSKLSDFHPFGTGKFARSTRRKIKKGRH